MPPAWPALTKRAPSAPVPIALSAADDLPPEPTSSQTAAAAVPLTLQYCTVQRCDGTYRLKSIGGFYTAVRVCICWTIACQQIRLLDSSCVTWWLNHHTANGLAHHPCLFERQFRTQLAETCVKRAVIRFIMRSHPRGSRWPSRSRARIREARAHVGPVSVHFTGRVTEHACGTAGISTAKPAVARQYPRCRPVSTPV